MSAKVRKMRRTTMQEHVRKHKISEVQELEVIAMYEVVEKTRVVAEHFGVSDETVRRILKRNNVPRTHRHQKPTAKKKVLNCGKKYCWAAVATLRRLSSMTFNEIVEFTGIPASTVGNVISTRCADTVKLRVSLVVDIDAIEREYLAGATTYELGKKYEVNHTTISKWMRRRGHQLGKIGHGWTQPRICKRCGCEYQARSSTAKYCDECRSVIESPKPRKNPKDAYDIELAEHNPDIVCTGYHGKKAKGEFRCNVCGEEFTRKVRPVNTIVCPHCREEQQKAEWEKRHPRSYAVVFKETKTCIDCGAEFHTKYYDKLRCDSCGREHLRQVRNEVRRKRRAAKRGASVHENAGWPLLMKRDHGICQICGLPCDPKDRRWGDVGPLFPTQDHIVPLANGGQDTLANSQLAHHICNSLKGDREITTEVIRRAKEQATAYIRP